MAKPIPQLITSLLLTCLLLLVAQSASERDVACPETDTTPAAAPGLYAPCPRTAGSDASNAHNRGTDRGHQGQQVTQRRKSAKGRQEGIE